MYNLSELREMGANDDRFVIEMIELFLNNNKVYLENINAALVIKDWSSVKFNAHKMKPSILLFKIDSLKDVILKLNEYSGKEINLEEIPVLVKELNHMLNLVFDKIVIELKKN